MTPAPFRTFTLCLALLCPLYSCSRSLLPQRTTTLAYYQSGQVERAEDYLHHTMQREMPDGDCLRSNNAVWMLLDRAHLRFAQSDSQGAINDYRCAIDVMDLYRQTSLPEQLCQTLFQDDFGAYAGDDFEQVLARVYLALALIQEGDLDNACAILRQAEELQQTLKLQPSGHHTTQHFSYVDNALAKYLFALLLEKKGDKSNAQTLYHQSALLPDSENDHPDNATLLVLIHNGNAPYKVTGTADDSVVSAFALEMFLDAHGIPGAASSMCGIPVPVLVFDPCSMPRRVGVNLDHTPIHPKLAYDVASASCHELDQRIPLIAARALARLIARRGLVAAAHEHSSELGVFTDCAMCLANAGTCADTRSWGTLPHQIELTHNSVAPGHHNLTIHSDFPQSLDLNLPPGSLCIVHVFNIHPGVCRVLAPQHYLLIPGD